MDKETIGKLIKTKRKEKELSQKQLAELIQVSLTTVSKWETGVNLPDILVLEQVAKALDISLADFVADDRDTTFDTLSTLNSSASAPQNEPIASSAEIIIPNLQPEPPPCDIPAKSKTRTKGLKWVACILGLFTAIICVWNYFTWQRSNMAFLFEICDEYQGDYNGKNCYYIIAEYNKEPTDEDLINFGKDFRIQYEKQFYSYDLIIVIYVKEYDNFIKKGYNEITDYMTILFPA